MIASITRWCCSACCFGLLGCTTIETPNWTFKSFSPGQDERVASYYQRGADGSVVAVQLGYAVRPLGESAAQATWDHAISTAGWILGGALALSGQIVPGAAVAAAGQVIPAATPNN